MDFNDLLKRSWERFIADIINLVLFVLLGAVLSITIVLIPTVSRGFVIGILEYIRKGTKPNFNLLWDFEGFAQVALFLVVGGALIFIGFMLFIIPGVILSVIWLYAIYFIVDQNMGFWDAMKASKEIVSKTGFMNHLVVFIIICVLNALGSALAGLGTILTAPFSLVFLATAYIQITGK